jgi:MEMO1 family protein
MSASTAARRSSEPRPAAVAGSFYPGSAGALAGMIDELAAGAAATFPTPASLDPARLQGVLVPHAGLVYSGTVAAAAWRLLAGHSGTRGAGAGDAEVAPRAGDTEVAARPGSPPAPTIVLLGTNHGAAWLDGVGAWDRGPWWTPLGEVAIDEELTDAILGLGPPFVPDAACHLGEHSLEVQLPFVARLAEGAAVVALSVGAGTGGRAVAAGERLGRLLANLQAAGRRVVVGISSDMAHYPPAAVAEAVTDSLRPPIVRLDAEALATAEAAAVRRRAGVSCGMCGIEPAVMGLATLRAMGARPGVVLAAATSADAGGDPRRTVGYLAVGFEAG